MITFADPQAAEYLRKHRTIYTFRSKNSRTGPNQEVYDGAGRLMGLGTVTRMVMDPIRLSDEEKKRYAERSSFADWDAWTRRAIELHGVGISHQAIYRTDLNKEQTRL